MPGYDDHLGNMNNITYKIEKVEEIHRCTLTSQVKTIFHYVTEINLKAMQANYRKAKQKRVDHGY